MPIRAGRARKRRAAGRHRPDLQALGDDAHLPQDCGVAQAGRLQGQDAGRLVRRQRVPVHGLDGQARILKPTATRAASRSSSRASTSTADLQKQAACVSTMTYNEYWQVDRCRLEARGPRRLQLHRPGRLHDGRRPLRAREQAVGPGLRDPHGEVRARLDEGLGFCRATSPDEAVKIVLDNDASGAQKEPHQKRMMGEINKLTAGSNGKLDPADYERTVTTLLGAGGERPDRHHQEAPRRLDPCRDRRRARSDRAAANPTTSLQRRTGAATTNPPKKTILSGGLPMAMLIRGGTVINHDHSRRADVLIEADKIVAVAEKIARRPPAAKSSTPTVCDILPAASTRTRTWSFSSWARSRR